MIYQIPVAIHHSPITNHQSLSVVLATRNEEENIARCLESVKQIANEIIVVDENSTDKTREIAEKYGAKVFLEPHHDIFHVTKQIALDKACGDWILQLDADEVVTPELANEIKAVVSGRWLVNSDAKKQKLFQRHQELIEKRDGSPLRSHFAKASRDYAGQGIVGYYIARKNMFLGKPLIHAGVFPDGVIRLVKKGKARFPQKSVHEQMEVDGEVGWLVNSLEHYDSPTLKRYFDRMNRYTALQAQELKENKIPKNALFIIHYSLFKPLCIFLNLFIRHSGFKDGVRGFLWSFFSALHFPIAYFKYLTNNRV